MSWQWKRFSELTTDELYAILVARQEVFAVEQKVLYVDPDGEDQSCRHLFLMGAGQVKAYARIFPPGIKGEAAVIGRVLTTKGNRGKGLGKELMQEALVRIQRDFGLGPVEVGAQAYLEKFYRDLGFRPFGEPYDEVGIAHVRMRKT